MAAIGALPPANEKESCALPQSWQGQIVSKFERLEVTPFPERGSYDKDTKEWRDKCLPKYSALLQVLGATSVHPSTNARIAELLLRKLKLALRPSSSAATEEANFITSHGFLAYLRMTNATGTLDTSLSPLLRAATPRFCHLPGFLEALLAYEAAIATLKLDRPMSDNSESPEGEDNPLITSLVHNLSTPSHRLRLASLRNFEILEATPDHNSALAIMLQIEQTPLDLQNARGLAVHLRKLGQTYASLDSDSWLRQAIPAFLFGMMTVKLSPVWDDAVEAMKQIAEDKIGEEVIANLAFDWLETPSHKWDGPSRQPTGSRYPPLTDFECLNFMKLEKGAVFSGTVLSEPSDAILQTFEDGQETVSPRPDNARAKSLKVLSALPAVAEKRSRKLVPHLLVWTSDQDTPVDGLEEEEEKSPEGSWSLLDRKALVGVFSKFNNPKVLHQSQRAYDALLRLIANGDIEIQKSALKAILAWRQEGLKPYQENLEYLLDEARFRNELTVLFQGDHKIRVEHRQELMPVLLRLLYGRTISKKGAASGRHGLHATRLAVIRTLEVEDVGSFLGIALGTLQDIRVVDASGIREAAFNKELIPARKQVGLLNMVESIINELGTSVVEYMEALVNAVLYCLIWACRQLREDGEDADEEDTTSNTSLYKVARTTALKCICKLFQNAQSFDWTPYKDAIVSEAISPRIDKLPVETTQGVSWTLKLLATWSVLSKPAIFLSIDARILPKMIECLGLEKTKDEVKVFILTIVRNLVKLALAPAAESEYNELIKSELLDPNVDLLFKNIGDLLRNQPEMGRELLETAIETVVELCPIVEKSKNVEDMVDISTFLLRQPSRKVNPKIKGSILLILKQFITRQEVQGNAELKTKVYETIAPLFGFFKDRNNREALSEVLIAFASEEPSLQEVAALCSDLNSYVQGRLDEPDYNKRLSAYNSISGARETAFTIEQWTALLHNMVFFIRQDEEFGVLSTNSADAICKFVEMAKVAWDGPEHGAYVNLLSTVVLPEIYAGAREASETVRREHLRVFGFVIANLRDWSPVTDLTALVPESEEDTENAFFFHILSPAVSRQLQALRLLQEANERAGLHSKNVSQFFIPLLEHFVFGRPEEGSDDHGLAAQASTTIASLASSLEWQQYRATLRRFISFIESKPDFQKRVIRLLEKVVDSLRTAISDKKGDAMDVDQGVAPRRLASTLPSQEKLSDEIVGSALPTLLKYLHEKDETTVSARVPVGVIIVKLLKLLPSDLMNQKLPSVLTDIAHILRSKAWESREMARDTLAKATCILGAEGFGFVLKELRGALTRGYQLHVLSYTLHSILVNVIPKFKQGELDYCLSSIVAVIMDDIFGMTGQEKDAEGYASQMKEVKSSKSQDSMELVAKNASIVHLVDMVHPLQSLLMEKLDLRIVRKIEDLLSRITSGLLQNPAAESRDTLVFAYEVIQEVYNSRKPEAETKIDHRLRRYLIQKGAKKNDRGATTKHTYKLVRFALDIIRSAMKKHDSLRTAANLAGFLPILGDAVVGGEDEVKTAAFKLLTVVVKVPSKSEDFMGLYKVATKEAIKGISMSATTSTDLAQSALKLLSVLMRERRDIPVKDAAIDMLLKKLKHDLTEPLYRHVTFNFLRSVLDRKVETADVYDTLDYVGSVMITNDDKDTRDLARGAFFQFLRDYPQKKSRWAKQLSFVVANLKYEREGGRLSVMEVIHLLLMKSANDFVQEVAATCFIPLVFVVANDDSEKCRLAAGGLVKEIFGKADREHMQKFLTLLRSWLQQDENPAVLKLALEAFGFYFEAREASVKDKKDLDLVMQKVTEVLSAQQTGEPDWELANASLQLVHVLLEKHPQKVLSQESQVLWDGILGCLSHQHSTVRLASIKLLSMYLADFASNTKAGTTPQSFSGSHGLELNMEDIFNLAQLTLGILTASEVEEAPAEEAVQVLLFLGGYLESHIHVPEPEGRDSADEDGDEPEQKDQRTGLGYLFWKLTAIIRKEVRPNYQSLIPKVAAMDVLEAFCVKSPTEVLLPSIKTILRPLRNLTDPSIPAPFSTDEAYKAKYDDLKTKAQSTMDLLQKKLGTAEYTKNLLAVGAVIKDRRQNRSSKRKVEAITQPEKYGRDKRKKFDKNKERRKAKGQQHRDLRHGY